MGFRLTACCQGFTGQILASVPPRCGQQNPPADLGIVLLKQVDQTFGSPAQGKNFFEITPLWATHRHHIKQKGKNDSALRTTSRKASI